MKLPHLTSVYRDSLTRTAAALGVVAAVSTASAALLVDPNVGGTVLSSMAVGDGNKDDGVASSPVYFDAPFFGSPLSNPFPTISFNGHIYFGSGDGSGDYAYVPFGTSPVTRISPMWTDMVLGATSQVVQNTGADLGDGFFAYNAITWVNMQGGEGNEGFTATFQAIYFNAAAILNGISFNPGDIAFSYGSIGNFDIPADIMIGLDKGTGGYATLPGYELTEGWASYSGYGDLPVGPGEYVRFRPNGNTYGVTIQPIPEPSAIMMFLGCGLLFVTRRMR